MSWLWDFLLKHWIGILWGVGILVMTGTANKYIPKLASFLPKKYSKVKFIIENIIQSIVWIIGGLGFLSCCGMDITSILAGLGLAGFSIGLALKDLLTNVVSGFILLMYQPFVVSDRVQIGIYDGIVDYIDLRYTKLSQIKGKGMNPKDIVLIPNSTILTGSVVVRAKTKAKN